MIMYSTNVCKRGMPATGHVHVTSVFVLCTYHYREWKINSLIISLEIMSNLMFMVPYILVIYMFN
jgi:hypothetical protein